MGDVFRFIQDELPDVYTLLSPMHERFEFVNAEALVVGAEVDCVEGDDREVVRNRYVVTEVIDIIAFLTGTRGDWEQQFREQNENIAVLAESAS